MEGESKLIAGKSAQIFLYILFESPSGHGRLRWKSWTSAARNVFSCGQGDGGGEQLYVPGDSGIRVRNVRRRFRPENLCLCCLFIPEHRNPFHVLEVKEFGRITTRAFHSNKAQKTNLLDAMANISLLLIANSKWQKQTKARCSFLGSSWGERGANHATWGGGSNVL